MASNDPGLAPLNAPAEEPEKGAVNSDGSIEVIERPVAPDQFDPRYETSRSEIWAYYA